MSEFITVITETEVEDRRQRRLDNYEHFRSGKRGQPPMVNRLAFVTVYVDHLVREGVPLETTHNSEMNKRVLAWLNGKAVVSKDHRKSRRKPITPDAVQSLLKQVQSQR